MNNFREALDFFRVPTPYRDLVDIVTGFIFLLFIQIFTKFNFLGSIGGLNFGRLETDFLLLLIAYFTGKIIFILSNIINDLFFMSVKIFKDENRKDLRNKIKIYFASLLYNERPSISEEEKHEEASILDIALISDDYPSIGVEIERIDLYNRMVGEFAVLALIIGLWPSQYVLFGWSHWFVVAAFIFFCLDVASARESDEKIYLAYKVAKRRGPRK